jgi:hypothetical protein
MNNEDAKRRYRIMTMVVAGAYILLGAIVTIRVCTSDSVGITEKLVSAAVVWGFFIAGLWELRCHYKKLDDQ